MNPEIPAEIRGDKKLYAHVTSYGPMDMGDWKRPKDPFHSLIRSIIYQQVSGKAAESILNKFKGVFGNKFPTPQELLKAPVKKLRSAGLSGQKVSYVKDLAKHFGKGSIRHRDFKKWTNDEIVEHLIRVKGIGVWTVHMFLIFTLKRPDVLPTLDLAIRKGFQSVYKLKKEPTNEQMEKLAKGWRNHATLASLYLWKAADGLKVKKSIKS